MRILKIIAALLTLTLCACGFHLRGSLALDLPEGVEPIHITRTSTDGQLQSELRKLLASYKVRLTPNHNEAKHQLSIIKHLRDRRTASIGNGARATEIQLIEEVSFELINKQGQRIFGPHALTERRMLRNNPNNVASTNSEENLLRREMLTNLAAKIARSIGSVDFGITTTPSLHNVSSKTDSAPMPPTQE